MVDDAIGRLAGRRLLVIGDLMVDRYQWGDVERVSPEAPVPVVRVNREDLRLGGAANVAHNLIALGCRVTVCGAVGEDPAGRDLRERLDALGAETALVVTDSGRPTTVKLRVMAQQQQMLRLDWESTAPLAAAQGDELAGRIAAQLGQVDGVIVSDYGKGLVTPELMAALTTAARAAGKPVVVDPKGVDYSKYRGATCLTPNAAEAAAAAHVELGSGEDGETLAVGEQLLAALGTEHLCITRGALGVLALSAGGAQRMFPAEAREVFDVTGAGDTFASVLGALLAGGVDFFDAVPLANVAAGIAVGRVGTATVSAEEIRRFGERLARLYTRADVGALAEALRAQGKRIVFTNGCFDLLHAGHIQYLRESRALGDVLIVGINSDESVRRLKGPARPVIGQEDRAHVLGALSFVDYVAVFEEDTPLPLLELIRPDILTKGADYTMETVVGHELVQSYGGEVRLIELKADRSTSGIIDKIVAGRQAEG